MSYHFRSITTCLFIITFFAVSLTTFAKYSTTTKGLGLARKNETPADTMIAQVATKLHGATRDLSLLDVKVFFLAPGQTAVTAQFATTGQAIAVGGSSASDKLVIIKEGFLKVSSGSLSKTLGPGGIALFPAGDNMELANTSAATCSYYVFNFRSWTTLDRERAIQAGPPIFLDWTDMQMKTTEKGESRQIFNRPVAWLSKIDMHATTLNEGQISHPPHTHRNEEIILMRSGNVQMYIGGKYYPAKTGDIVFLTSGTPHNLENKTKGRCEYFALQWQQ